MIVKTEVDLERTYRTNHRICGKFYMKDKIICWILIPESIWKKSGFYRKSFEFVVKGVGPNLLILSKYNVFSFARGSSELYSYKR